MNGNDYRIELSDEDYRMAFTEVAFLIDAFASTVDNIMGGATAPVGRIAGRDTAKRLPEQPSDPTLETVIELLSRRMRSGFDFTLKGERLLFSGCVVREICKERGIETGGAICRLFHHYLDGMIDGLLFRPVKSEIDIASSECRVKIEAL